MVACRAMIGVVFFVAVASKLSSRDAYRQFSQSVRSMRVPESLTPFVITVEAIIAVAMATPLTVAGLAGFSIAALLLAAFVAGITRAIAIGSTVPCRCFGRSSNPLGRPHIVRNLALLAVAALGLTASLTNALIVLIPAMLAAVTGLVLGVLVIMFDDLVALFR